MYAKKILISFIIVFITTALVYADQVNRVVVVDNFDNQSTTNLLDGITQGDEESEGGCIPFFTQVREDTFGRGGHSLQLEFDVTAPGAFSYYSTQLGPRQEDDRSVQTMDLSDYAYLSFWFTSNQGKRPNFAIEIHKDSDDDGAFILGKDSSSRVVAKNYIKKYRSGRWQKVTIPLRDFSRIHTWDQIYEIVYVFDSVLHSGQGTMYIDDIIFGSQYPYQEEEEDVRFPGSLSVHLCRLNNNALASRFTLHETNTIELLIKNIHPFLECVQIEANEYGRHEWFPVCRFYEHMTGAYTATWHVSGDEKKFFFLRIVAIDVFGNTHVLKGPLGGYYMPKNSTI